CYHGADAAALPAAGVAVPDVARALLFRLATTNAFLAAGRTNFDVAAEARRFTCAAATIGISSARGARLEQHWSHSPSRLPREQRTPVSAAVTSEQSGHGRRSDATRSRSAHGGPCGASGRRPARSPTRLRSRSTPRPLPEIPRPGRGAGRT